MRAGGGQDATGLEGGGRQSVQRRPYRTGCAAVSQARTLELRGTTVRGTQRTRSSACTGSGAEAVKSQGVQNGWETCRTRARPGKTGGRSFRSTHLREGRCEERGPRSAAW